MAILNNKTHISSEMDEKVLTDVTLNNNTGILTFTKTDYYNNPDVFNPKDNNYDEEILIDLKNIKLRIYKLDSEAQLNALANTTDAQQKIFRQTYIFLTPIPSEEEGEEGIYREHVWVGDENGGRFEVLGSTRLDLEQCIKKSKVVNNLNENSTFNKNDPLVLSAQQGYQLEIKKAPNKHSFTDADIAANNNQDKYGKSSTTTYGHSKAYNTAATDISLTTNNKGTKTAEFAMGDHVHKHPLGKQGQEITGKPTANATPSFGSKVTVSQVAVNATGHVDSLTDRTIQIPSNIANGTTPGLSDYNYSSEDKAAVVGIQNSIDGTVIEALDYLANLLCPNE